MRKSVLAFFFFIIYSSPTFACSDNEYETCTILGCFCAPKFSTTVPNAPIPIPIPTRPEELLFPGVGALLDESVSQGDAILSGASRNLANFGNHIEKALRDAIQNAISSQDKAVSDTAKNLVKATHDIIDATHAVARFAERETGNFQENLSRAEKRLREGKVADAVWHLSTDSWQATEKNAAQLAQENEIVAAAGQAVATAYGGPAGSAAYVAWLTYRKSGGNVDLALKAGVYAYVTAAGYANTSALPSGTAGEVAKKAAITGAVGGLAVASQGGSDEEVLKAFTQSGGAVIVQSGQSYVTKRFDDSIARKVDAYCVTAIGLRCAEAEEWRAQSIARLESASQRAETLATAKVTGDGNWAISWVNDTSSATPGEPRVVLTYVGDGSPFRSTLDEIASLDTPSQAANGWTAFNGYWGKHFNYVDLGKEVGLPQVGDKLRAITDINIRRTPRAVGDVLGQLKSGTPIKVLEVTVAGKAGGSPQRWMRFQVLPDEYVYDVAPRFVRPATANTAASQSAVSPDRKIAALGTGDDRIRTISLSSGERITAFALRPETGGMAGGSGTIAFSSDGTKILGTGFVGALKVWDAKTGSLLRSYGRGNSQFQKPRFLANDNIRFAEAGSIVTIDASTGERIQSENVGIGGRDVYEFSEDPSGDVRFLVLERQWNYRLYRQDLRPVGQPTPISEKSICPNCFAISDDGLNFAASFIGPDEKNQVAFGNLYSGEIGSSWLYGQEARILSMAISPDKKQIAFGIMGGDVLIADIRTGKISASLASTFGTNMNKVYFLSDRVVAAGQEGAFLVWELRN